MIILITIGLICFVGYSVWIINRMCDIFHDGSVALFASLVLILLPSSIIGQILVWTGVIK